MSGRGQAPKANRRNRMPLARGDWVDLDPLEQPILPELPEGEWRPETVAAWEAWRMDPVSAQWSPADVAFAWDTIRLHNVMENATGASEVRLRMDSLGLTPKGKRDLRWRISKAEPELAEVKPIAAKRLRAVG